MVPTKWSLSDHFIYQKTIKKKRARTERIFKGNLDAVILRFLVKIADTFDGYILKKNT